jgi:hypothetical protein
MTKVKTTTWKLVFIVYILSVLAFSFSVRANELTWMPSENSARLQKDLKVFSGEVVVDLEGNIFLVTTNDEVFELVSENLDLSELNGVFVQVAGFEPRYDVGPVYRTQALLPLLDEPSAQPLSARVLVVVSVRVIK